MNPYGHFDDGSKAYVITDPITPRPWLNYLGNGRLSAFLSQNAGGLLWLYEPATRRLTRYHFLSPPGDRPGFYLYVRNRRTATVWNPHFAPTCSPLDSFECRHSPGISTFRAINEGVVVELTLGIANSSDVLLWHVSVCNAGEEPAELDLCSYMEFGLLEFLREALGWCYLKSHFSLRFDPERNGIRYDYHVFEAPSCPAMIFACTDQVAHFDCSREAFIGRTGSLENPESLRPGRQLTDSQLPGGGHACAVLGLNVKLEPGGRHDFGYSFAVADTWETAEQDTSRFASAQAIRAELDEVSDQWDRRFQNFQIESHESGFSRFVNVWNPYNAFVTLENCRIISTDHMGTDGLRFRDTSQDALAVVTLDSSAAASKLRLVLENQKADGDGCFAFFPNTSKPAAETPHRSDNVVWPVFSYKALVAETGDLDILDEKVRFRDGGSATVYEHLRAGLDLLWSRRGPHGLPKMSHADWNDGLALFRDPDAESVMLGFQFVAALRDLQEFAAVTGRKDDVETCGHRISTLEKALNSDFVWDGAWYCRLLLSNGKRVGSETCKQGKIYLDVQPWAVMSAARPTGRGALAMDSVAQRLATPFGLAIVSPSYRGFPEPEDPPLGSGSGTNENGGVFCHANTWAIIAECMLRRPDRAFDYYMRLMPDALAQKVGADLYEREPYVYVSSLWGPESPAPGRAGISWLTGTASWMYIAATQYILGVRPTLAGLLIDPCLPSHIESIRIQRKFRGAYIEITVENSGQRTPSVLLDGSPVEDRLLRNLTPGETYHVRCFS